MVRDRGRTVTLPWPRVRNLLSFAGAVAGGDEKAIARAYTALRRSGAGADDVAEVLALVSAFCGWPAALGGYGAVFEADPTFRPGPAPRPRTRGAARAAGRRNFTAVYGIHAPAILARIARFDPTLAELLLEVPYGEIYARPLLPLAVKELVACLLLVHLGRRRELRGHLLGALRCGATQVELEAVIALARRQVGADRASIASEELERAAALARQGARPAERMKGAEPAPLGTSSALRRPRGERAG